MADVPCLNPQQFTNLILQQLPVYSPTILRDVRPIDGLLAHISTGQWDPFRGVVQVQDRFRNVKANVAKKWQDVTDETCAGAPCDPIENEIGWGTDRITFGQQKQSWRSKTLCFDQMLSATQAVEHIEQIVDEILRPASMDIGSFYVRKMALQMAGNKLLANSTMSPFTWAWNTVGNEEISATPSAWPTSKLTPEMIQRQLPRMRNRGYFGKWTNDPFFGGYEEMAELITDDDTCWDMDKLATNQRISDQWRFQLWNAAHEYYKYGMGGQIGNYMTHVDPFCLRFFKNGNNAELVLPFVNGTATQGIGSDDNPDFHIAPYQISFIWHRFAWALKVQQMQAINALCPFLVRGLDGSWRFAMHDLGADCVTGKPIPNYRENKGFFWADWRWGAQPLHTEWLTAIFHMREPKTIYEVAPCAADPGHPKQVFNSANANCIGTYNFDLTGQADGRGRYVIPSNTITCNDAVINNGIINAANIGALVDALNADSLGAATIGTWSYSGTTLIVSGATCEPIILFDLTYWAYTPILTSANYTLLANTVKCNGVALTHVQIQSASIAQLIINLNASEIGTTGGLGTWVAGTLVGSSLTLTTTTISLYASSCHLDGGTAGNLPWVV
mgnify:CR=1 FL=1